MKKNKQPEFRILGDSGSSLDDIIGQTEAKEELNKLLLMLESPKLCDIYGVTIPNMLLHGNPGTGKTLSVNAIADELEEKRSHVLVYSVNLQDIGTAYINETANNFDRLLSEVVYDVQDSENYIDHALVFFDEFDSMAVKRGSSNTKEDDKLVNVMNSYLDGDKYVDHISYIAATNFYESIDNAIKSRFQKHIKYTDFDSEDEISDLFKVHIQKAKDNSKIFEGYSIFKNVQYSKIAKMIDGKVNGRDVKSIVNRVVEHKLFTLLNEAKTRNTPGQDYDLQIGLSDFEYIVDKYNNEKKDLMKEKKIGFAK